MGLSGSWCGRCIMVFFTLLFLFSVWAFMSADYIFLDEDGGLMEVNGPIALTTERFPMLSADKKTIYVISEEGLPWANNFILRNPSIPVTKIVFRKPGVNSSVHVYPVQRDAMLATNRKQTEVFEEISFLMAIVFVLLGISMGVYMIFCQEVGCMKILAGFCSCDHGFDWDPKSIYGVDFDDMDELFDTTETDDDDSAGDSPIKQQKKINKKNAGDTRIIMDELKKPLLDV